MKDLGDTGFTLAESGDNVTVNCPDSEPQSDDQENQAMTNYQVDGSSVTAENTLEKTGQELAIQFSSWFYKLLASLASSTEGTSSPDWGPQHFWQDATLTVQCSEPSGSQETTVEGADLVSEKFLSMVVVDQLCFNPNISPESTKGQQNPHGLVVVMACGTVHRNKEYLGVFEQSFGLIRDPSEENNWKIKFSKLLLKASGSSSKNQLEHEEAQNQLE